VWCDDGITILSVLSGDDDLDGVHGGPPIDETTRSDRAACALHRVRHPIDRARHADHDVSIRKVDALRVDRSAPGRRECHRTVGCIEPQEVGCERDAAPARIGLEQPASHAVEDVAWRRREIDENRRRRGTRGDGGGREPGLDAPRGVLDPALEGRALEDHGVRRDRRVGQRVRDEPPHRGDAIERVRQRGVGGERRARARQGGEAPQHRTHELPAQLRNALRREQPKQRALERIAVIERRDPVVPECHAEQCQEISGDPGALRTHAS
jgi:hypothetical protein